MVTTLTLAEAGAAAAERCAERDRIQANLLELDNSFGKRLLAGATLTGGTAVQWESAAADLASVWDVFASYSAVVQRVANALDGTRFVSNQKLAAVSALLTGPSVAVTGQDVPLARRHLTSSAQAEERLTLDLAVQRMTAAFNRVAEVVSAAEGVWTAISRRLDEISTVLGPATQEPASSGDDGLDGKLSAVEADVRRLREVLNTDPLSLWQAEHVAVDGADQLLQRARAVASQTAELARLRADADQRIAEVADQVAAARACEEDARKQLEQARQKISADHLPPAPPGTDNLTARLADLHALRGGNRLHRLATELQAIDKDAGIAAKQWRDAGAAASALLDRRTELRGLLEAYEAKAGRLGAAEDSALSRRLQVARELLWVAPCDLSAAAEAVRSYQNAVLAIQKGTP
jgi:hypothetical protein